MLVKSASGDGFLQTTVFLDAVAVNAEEEEVFILVENPYMTTTRYGMELQSKDIFILHPIRK